MRYRRDIPRGDTKLEADTILHVVDHLRGAADPNDVPTIDKALVNIQVSDHVDGDHDLVSVIGSLDAAPNAPYLKSDFDPAQDHPEIKFIPFEEPEVGHFSSEAAFTKWQKEQSS